VDQHISRYCSIIGETEYLVKKKCKRNKVQKNKKTLETREEVGPAPPPPRARGAFMWYGKLEERREMELSRRERERRSSWDFLSYSDLNINEFERDYLMNINLYSFFFLIT